MNIKHTIIFPLISLVIGVVLAFIMGEVILRILKIGYSESPLTPDAIFHHVHPKNYRYVAYHESKEFGGFDVQYDSIGNITNPAVTKKKSSYPCHVVFLGDSFTEARQVPYEHSFVGLLERGSPCRIDNYGTTSYSPIFYLLQWRKLIQQQKPDLVVVQLYSNDIQADTDYAEIAVRDSSGQVIAIPGPDKTWFYRQLRHSYLLRYLRKIQLQFIWLSKNNSTEKHSIGGLVEENPEITPFSRDTILTLHKEVISSNSKFLLMVVPSKFKLAKKKISNKARTFDKKWEHIADTNNLPYLDLSETFEQQSGPNNQLFFEHDIHFNKLGHRVVSDVIRDAYPGYFTEH